MKNNELLKKYAGISTRIRRIFAYHYDQIQREPKEEDLEEIISHTSYFDIHVDDAIYEVLTMPSRDGNPITRKQKSFINLRYQTYSNN